MREGGKILAGILRKLEENAKLGVATLELEKLARKLVSDYGVKPSFLGYNGFPAALCTSVNEEIVHGIPSDRELKDGDLLKLDMGVEYKGFHTDSATTVLVGEKNGEKKNLIDVARKALEIGLSKALAGNTTGHIGSAIQEYVESQNFNVPRDLVGHGIGEKLHESPEVPNYGHPGEGVELEPGMVLAIEPMVLAGGWKVKEKASVFVTKDGSLAAHFEHTVAITDKEPIILTLE